MNILVAVLTSRDIEKLKRCIESVLPQTSNVVVVCNTLDFSFVEQARSVAQEYSVEFLVTESNGTPARGKNSVLEIFRTRLHDYYMQVDADDYLAPDVLIKLAKIVDENPDVDVIGLIDGAMTYNGTNTTGNAFFNSADIYKFANVKGSHGLRLIELGKFLAANLLQNRMLLYSKKVINSFDFDETFLGSEDVVASYKLYYNPEINYVLTNEHLYVYDLEDSGNFYAFLSNPIEIKKVLRELKVIVNESRIQN
jgi:cellulose synthase/poly-beta-1,6-N-acetylglucosamine synthase-like glycosyltransferase